MNEVEITTKHYNSNLVKAAKKLGANWNGESWVFPAHSAAKAEKLKEVYESKHCVVEIEYNDDTREAREETFFGYTVAKTHEKGSGKTYDTFQILKGDVKFGGSNKYPTCYLTENAVIRAVLPHLVIKKSVERMSRDDVTIKLLALEEKKGVIIYKNGEKCKEIIDIDDDSNIDDLFED